MPAVFQGTSFLITFPQDNFDIDNDFDSALAHFRNIGDLKYLRIGVEQHASGDPHWHAVAYYAVKLRLGARAFDYRDKHPNVQTVGRRIIDWQRCIDYVAKDGHFREHGTPRHGADSVWAEVSKAGSRVEAEQLIAAAAPRDWIINRRNIDYAMEALFPLQPCSSFQPRDASSFCVPDGLMQWLSSSLVPPPPLTLRLWILDVLGQNDQNPWCSCPSQDTAKLNGQDLSDSTYTSQTCGTSAFDGILDSFWHCGYVVFDDISWDSIKGTAKSWFGAQRDFTVSDKYRRKRRMPGGVPCIFLINPDAYVLDCYNFITGAWGKENIDVVWLRNKLY
ncbi:replication-associated protein [Blackfly DNA Virus 18]|nr:replication-associated protein [Blackfly DNA Virus 18]